MTSVTTKSYIIPSSTPSPPTESANDEANSDATSYAFPDATAHATSVTVTDALKPYIHVGFWFSLDPFFFTTSPTLPPTESANLDAVAGHQPVPAPIPHPTYEHLQPHPKPCRSHANTLTPNNHGAQIRCTHAPAVRHHYPSEDSAARPFLAGQLSRP